MHFDEADSELLKQWIVKKLEDISDADSDVLADYVLALIKTDEPEAVVRSNCVENLSDFLFDNTPNFVNDVFATIATKAYDPSRPKPAHLTSHAPNADHGNAPKQLNESRKRPHADQEHDESNSRAPSNFLDGQRPMKQARRGGRGGFEQRGGRHTQHQSRHSGSAPFAQPDTMLMSQMPALPPGMDPSAFSAFMAMQQAMGLLPGFPNPNMTPNQSGSRSGQRCRSYDTRGYCAKGAACPYEHGDDPLVIPQNNEYDPSQATLLNVQPSRTGFVKTQPHERNGHRGRSRGAAHSRGGRRSDFSHHGPRQDRSKRQIVVEQIPDDYLNETSVREFFDEFGSIEEVTMQSEQRLAVLKFDSHEAAKAAYESPKVIFDNRFVKVYWHKSDSAPKHQNGHAATQTSKRNGDDIEMHEAEPEIDLEEVARKQEEAQRKHEEQQKNRGEAEKQKLELDAKIKEMENMRKKMMQKLANRTNSSTQDDSSNALTSAADTEQTKGLREQLAKLEAEAKSLGIDPDAPTGGQTEIHFRGRGGFRGRARGRGYAQSYRGGWAAGGVRGGGAVKRLDNRPKTVAITFLDGSYDENQGALRQFLLFNSTAGDSASLDQHPDRKDTALVAFPERYQGEMFMTTAASPEFPFLGKVDMSWYKQNQAPPVQEHTALTQPDVENEEIQTNRDMDAYDEADDDDRWG